MNPYGPAAMGRVGLGDNLPHDTDLDPRQLRRADHAGEPIRRVASALRTLGRIPGLPFLALGAAATSAAALYSRFVEPRWLETSWEDLVLPGLPRTLDGLILAHLSDLHVSEAVRDGDAVAQAIHTCNGVRPDLAVITGDLVSRREAVGALADRLGQLTTRPVYVVFGNHEYRFGPSHRHQLTQALTDLGMTVLANQSTAYERRGGRLWIAGVDDGYTSHARLGRALADLAQTDRPRVLLSHYPDLAARPEAQDVDLVLSGHSHGGQINLPILIKRSLARADTAFAGGRYQIGHTTLYVSRGLGTSGYPVRLLARPQLVFFILRSMDVPV